MNTSLYSPGQYNHLSDTQISAIVALQFIIFAFGGVTSVLLLVNLYKYLIKQKRYKEITICLFYLNAALVLAFVLIDVQDSPSTNFCAYRLIISEYGSMIMFLNLGICWCATITNLVIHLDSLFQLKNDIHVGTYEDQEDIEERIRRAYKRLRTVKVVTVVLNLINYAVLGGTCVWFKMVVDSAGDGKDYYICQGEDAYD